MSKVTRDQLMQSLADCIASAPDGKRQHLAETLHGYAVHYGKSYRNLCNGDSLIAAVLETLEEATDARIERDGSGVPIEQ